MNALKSGIDAQSQIISGEDPEALERLKADYYDRFQPQSPEEVALIDDAISSDWLLRRLRKTEAQLWDRSITETAAGNRKWGHKAEAYPVAAAFRDQQKVFERLQHRISCVERSLRTALETLARLRKQRGTGLPCSAGDPSCSAGDLVAGELPNPSPTPSKDNVLPEIGFVPEIQPVVQTPVVAPAVLPPVKARRPLARVPLDPPCPDEPSNSPANPPRTPPLAPNPTPRDIL